MKSSTITHQNIFVIDGQEYWFTSTGAKGLIVTATTAPHSVRAISNEEFANLLRSPRLRCVPGGASRAGAERKLDGRPEYFRDLAEKDQKIALWRQTYVEILLAEIEAGDSKWNEPSVNRVLPKIIAAADAQIRDHARGIHKRAGRIVLNRTPPCAKSLITWARRYRNAGYDIMALVPETHRSGQSGSRMQPGELAAFEELLGLYLTPLGSSIDKVHESATNLYVDINRARLEQDLPAFSIPSRSTVYRAIQALGPYETYLQRHGVSAANSEFALSEYGVQALRPMERVEIDEWEVDLMTLVTAGETAPLLTDKEITALKEQRLFVCVAIDCATRCIVGLTLSRSTTSEAAIRCLETVTIDKTDIAVQFGCRAGWHQAGRPEVVATDQGSAFVAEVFKIVVAGLHSRLLHPPGGVPKLRSRIERVFRTFGTHLVSRFRGRTFSNPEQRGDYDSEAEASLTEHDLLAAFVTYIVDVYHQRPHRGLQGETPAQCWDRLTKRHGPTMPVDAMDRRAIFGVELERAVTGRGVRVFGADYACDELREAYKHRHVHKVRLRFDQLDMGWIAVEVAGKWYPAYDLSRALSGVSFYQWCAYAKTVMDHHREGAALTAEVYHDGLRRLELLSTEAAKAAQLGRMTLSADEVDKAEKALGLGLHLLPAASTTESGAESDWFNGGFEAGVETDLDAEDVPLIQSPQDDETPFPLESSSSDGKDIPPSADDDGDDPFAGGGWGFEDDQ